MATMKSDKERGAEIKKLEACKSYVPRTTAFGDDNHKRIDAQIYTIKNKLTERGCTDRFVPDETDGEPSDEDYDVESNARDAAKWVHGDAPAPSLDWEQSFKTRKKKKS